MSSRCLYLAHERECRRLHAEGLLAPAIAARVGIAETTVRLALADPDKRARMIKLKSSKKNAIYAGVRHIPTNPIEKPSKVLVEVPREVRNDAIVAYAGRQIDRIEMMRRITPREKWREEWSA